MHYLAHVRSAVFTSSRVRNPDIKFYHVARLIIGNNPTSSIEVGSVPISPIEVPYLTCKLITSVLNFFEIWNNVKYKCIPKDDNSNY